MDIKKNSLKHGRFEAAACSTQGRRGSWETFYYKYNNFNLKMMLETRTTSYTDQNLPTSSEVITRLDYLFNPMPIFIAITIATSISIFGSITIPVSDSSAISISGSVSSSVSVISNYPFVEKPS